MLKYSQQAVICFAKFDNRFNTEGNVKKKAEHSLLFKWLAFLNWNIKEILYYVMQCSYSFEIESLLKQIPAVWIVWEDRPLKGWNIKSSDYWRVDENEDQYVKCPISYNP